MLFTCSAELEDDALYYPSFALNDVNCKSLDKPVKEERQENNRKDNYA